MTEVAGDLVAGQFVLPKNERVVYGPGCSDQIAAYVQALGARRVMIITGQTLACRTDLVQRLVERLGTLCAEVFAGVRAHAPLETVFEAAARARSQGVDLLIGFGGGSAIDTAKAVAAVMATGVRDGREFETYYMRVEGADTVRVPSIDGPVIPQIAIPTTLSAAEFTGTAGFTDFHRRVKHRVRDPKLTPRIVLLDPEVTRSTPDWLWTSTGIRAVDHAVEAIYGKEHGPISDALALSALEILFEALPRCRAHPEAMEPRGRAQVAAGMAIWAMGSAGAGLSHGIGYVLGARFDVPHGLCSCVTLPHVMRFNRPVTRERQALIARRLRLVPEDADDDTAAAAAADAVAALIRSLGHPTRLRDVGVGEDDLPAIAEDTMRLPNALSNPRRASYDEVLALLKEAW